MAVMVDPERQQQDGFGEQAAEGWTSQSFSLGFVANARKTGMRLHDYFVVVLLHNSNLSRTGCGWRIRALCKCNPPALNGPYLSFSSHLREVAYWSDLVWSPDQFCPSMSVR